MKNKQGCITEDSNKKKKQETTNWQAKNQVEGRCRIGNEIDRQKYNSKMDVG